MHLIFNSNPWFSAVSDYSLQMCLYLKREKNPILYCAHIGHTQMDKKCAEHDIPFFPIPLHHQNVFHVLKSFYVILKLLIQYRKDLKHVVAFEGREHALLVLTKILFPCLWRDKILIRVRGQAQAVKSNVFSRWIYNHLTDRVVFAATCVKNRMGFDVPDQKSRVQLYGKNFPESRSGFFTPPWGDGLTFLLLGRFDPVKGHDDLVQAYLKADLKIKSNLVFIGKSENLKSDDMRKDYLPLFESDLQHKKNLYVIDERISNLSAVLKQVHFGVIPSRDSEVICRVGVEFLHSGIPVLYSDAGALPEVFVDFPQFLFKKCDPADLAVKLELACAVFLESGKFEALQSQAKKVGKEKYHGDVYRNLF